MPNKPVASFIGPRGIRQIACDIQEIDPGFPARRFIQSACKGIDKLALFARATHVAEALGVTLSRSFPSAVRLLIDASGPPREQPGYGPMENFRYLAFTRFVSLRGAGHLSDSLHALKQLTRRFTAEFDIRPFLLGYERETLRELRRWIGHDDLHVRRLVSEGTRTRLPWSSHLRSFQQDPRKVLSLIELLKSDTSRYVQVSVANSLADIIKDNPEFGFGIAERWASKGHPTISRIVHHAVRLPAQRGSNRALALRVPREPR